MGSLPHAAIERMKPTVELTKPAICRVPFIGMFILSNQ